jgi:ribosomal protein S1
MVLEIDPAGRRIRLSMKAVRDAAEQADVRDYAARADAASESSGFGSLADKLRGALDPRRRG